MQSVPGTQSPLYEIPSVTDFTNWTVTSAWLFRKNIPEVFPQGDCNMHMQSNHGLVSSQGNLKFKQPHISIFFFLNSKDRTYQEDTSTRTARVYASRTHTTHNPAPPARSVCALSAVIPPEPLRQLL